MRILVFGAGVIGCNLARNLFRAGKDVTLLARGAWAEDIQKNGLRIKDKFSPRMSVTLIPVVTELKPEDQYDVIFVVMRYTQVGAIMDTLRANPAKNIVFVGNDVRAEEIAGHEILPDDDKEFEGAAYRKTCLRFFKLMCATSLGKLCAADHAMNAIGEMSALNRDLKKFFDKQGTAYPVWQELEKDTGKYLEQA